MRKDEFRTWMKEVRKLSVHTATLRVSNCNKVENAHGCLDKHFTQDKGRSLLTMLAYSTNDERENVPARHRVEINGNLRTNTATYRQAVNHYMKFRADQWKPQEIEPIEMYL